MAVTTLTCYRLDCDTCGKPVTGEDVEGDRFGPHYETPDEAFAGLYGDPDVENDDVVGRFLLEGQRLDDGSIICGPCNQTRLCGERGHRWAGWRFCYCDQCDPWNDLHRVRACDRNHCVAFERRPTPATT